jgi:hypothetical protein
MSHNNLANYFKTNLGLKKNGWTIDEIESLPIFERDVYISLTMQTKNG